MEYKCSVSGLTARQMKSDAAISFRKETETINILCIGNESKNVKGIRPCT
jgi:hypothetical protein